MIDEPRNVSGDEDYTRAMGEHLARLMDSADTSKDHSRSVFDAVGRAKLDALKDEGDKA